jgi:hypothetical protein
MPYDEALAARVRQRVKGKRGVKEKRLFGGVGFLLNGNMWVGVWKHWLILRVGPEAYEALLERPHVREFDITGRAMSGWVMVEAAGYEGEASLSGWMETAEEYVKALPRKK